MPSHDSFIPKNLVEVIEYFSQSDDVHNNPKLLANLKTSLKKYVLPSLGWTNIESTDQFAIALMQVNLVQFLQEADTQFEAVYKELLNQGKSRGTLDNYKSALKRFLYWARHTGWYREILSINDDRYIPVMRRGYTLTIDRKGKRAALAGYSLPADQLTDPLQKQLTALHRFLTAPEVPKRRDGPIREKSWETYFQAILAFLGWLHHSEEYTLEQLDVTLMADLERLEEYIAWGISDRGNGYAWAMNIATAALNIAKWQHYRRSEKPMYRDVPEIEAMRFKLTELGQKRKKEASRLHLDEKMLSLDQCEEVVQYLRRCTAPKTRCRSQRSQNAIMQSWRRYLIIALLTYVPVRQREIRELELGRTLFREADGYWVKLAPKDHKNGSKTGKGREYPLPDVLTADLDYWLNELRPKIPTEHNYVFIHLNASRPESYGHPLSAITVGSLVKTTMYTATGNLFDNPKRTTPHDFRRIAITWQRKHGNPAQQEALAELMGHSVQEANKTYSQLTSRDVTERAKEWWKPITNLAPLTPVKLPTAPTQPKSNQTTNYKIVSKAPKAIDLPKPVQDDSTNKKLKSTPKTDNSEQPRDDVSISVQLNVHLEQQQITKKAQSPKVGKVKATPPIQQLNLFDVDDKVSS